MVRLRSTRVVATLLLALVVCAGCTPDALVGHGSGAEGTGGDFPSSTPAGTASGNGNGPTSAAPSSAAPSTLTFRLAGRAKPLTLLLVVDGKRTVFRNVRLPWRHEVNASASRWDLTTTFTNGQVNCTITDESGTVITTAGASGTGNAKSKLNCGASR